MFKKGDAVRNQYGEKAIVLDSYDNIVWTTRGIWHATKTFKVK